jgi:hypothetical protein
MKAWGHDDLYLLQKFEEIHWFVLVKFKNETLSNYNTPTHTGFLRAVHNNLKQLATFLLPQVKLSVRKNFQ